MTNPRYDPLSQIHVKNKVEMVVERITRAVLDGIMKPGDRFPSEREVAEKMGVSRASVREAFSALQVAGLIERKGGSGNYIANVVNPQVLRTRALMLLSSNPDPLEVWGARAVLEPALAEQIVEHVCDSDVDELETACRDLEEAGNASDWSTYIEADHRFHMALVAATRNNPLIQVIGPLVSEMRAPLARAMKESYFLSTEASVQASEAIHRDILAAAKSKNAGALRRALQHHFERLRKVIEGDAEETPATVGLASGSDPAVTPSTS